LHDAAEVTRRRPMEGEKPQAGQKEQTEERA
jgi:hypothetical protein